MVPGRSSENIIKTLMGDIFFLCKIFLKLTRYHDRVSMLSFMLLFLDFSSDHWKFESLLLCFCKPYGENSRMCIK
jgi:hypothetical protein